MRLRWIELQACLIYIIVCLFYPLSAINRYTELELCKERPWMRVKCFLLAVTRGEMVLDSSGCDEEVKIPQ